MSDSNKPPLFGKLDLLAKRAAPAGLADKPALSSGLGQQASSSAYPKRSDTSTLYFYSSHKTLTILDQHDQKVKFENHFLVTTDKELAQHIRDHYAKKKSGSIQIREVNHFFYEQSGIIQPVIEPLPPAENDIIPPEPRPLMPNLGQADVETRNLLNTPIDKIPDVASGV